MLSRRRTCLLNDRSNLKPSETDFSILDVTHRMESSRGALAFHLIGAVALLWVISAWQEQIQTPVDIPANSSPPGQTSGTISLKLDIEKSNQLKVNQLTDDEIELTTLGEDPFIVLQRFAPADVTESQTVLAFEYFSLKDVDGLTIYYGPPINATKQFSAGSLEKSQSWQPYAIDLQMLSGGKWSATSNQLRLDFGRLPGITFRLRNLHLREPNIEEMRSHVERKKEKKSKLTSESRINTFYKTKFLSIIDSVQIDKQSVVIRGAVEKKSNIRLLEILPEVSMVAHANIQKGELLLDQQSGIIDLGEVESKDTFERQLPRFQDGRDRTISRWAIAERNPVDKWKLLSHWKYATDLSAGAATPLTRLVPKGIKGMGGVSSQFPLNELVELGVHNITVNISVSHFMDSVPHQGWILFDHGGREWFVNLKRLAEYDTLIRFASENEIVVSGILLVPFLNSEFGKMLVHPEADRAGHYAMPNFTTADGVAAYEAVIEFLAQRYSAPGLPQGRIANWIVHNEVGFGWEWTNMGWQPPMVYMDHYLRSMRLVHNVTRRHDPHSRVFISLTHHWNTPTNPSWKSYSNIELLERLVESSSIEGDFAWGVAFHPYPQNLRKPDAWNDTRVTNEFQTPLITPKNIAVLDRWMQQPKMRNSTGDIRGVLLSEQGFNTTDYSVQSQRLQAAGFVYMWRQMRGLKSIEAFHNHRWVDHPNEGGLLLGLRKLPENGKPYGEKKFSWGIYKALETPDESAMTSFADEIIQSRQLP